MLWITNHPKPLKGLWPRRVGCTYIEGAPQATEARTSEDLKNCGLIGVYVNMSAAEYYRLPVADNPKEFAALS